MRHLFVSLAIFVLAASGLRASELWSLLPIEHTAPPASDSDWPRTEIDRFIAAEWVEIGVSPVVDADAQTLHRRLRFNLTGLPPTLDQIKAFKAAYAKNSKAAIEQLVDELLGSRAFGETWARHWLDLARYSESNGKDRDVIFPNAWRYRDYVISAFNADKPFDGFVREQIAGDLLEDAGDEQIVATAFLAMGPKAFGEPDKTKFALDLVDEQIDVLTRSVLGLTVACARCHDHKFDPVATKDYYAMAGILLSSETRWGAGPLYGNRHPYDTKLVALGPKAAELDPAVVAWKAKIIEMTEKVANTRSAAYRIQRDIAGQLRERGIAKAADDPELADKEKKMLAMRKEAQQLLDESVELTHNPPSEVPGYTMALSLRQDEAPKDCHVRVGGFPDDLGPKGERGAFEIPGMPEFGDVAESNSGRRQLADWLSSAENPLTARVWVNRVWRHLFGRGLVATVDNFGVMGEEPSHPELLDFLAAEFIADGWSTKRLVRRIVLSRTWQLSSQFNKKNDAVDPRNLALWHANYRRLDIEPFRDAMMSVSGTLIEAPREGSLFADIYPGITYGPRQSHSVANLDAEIAADRHRTVYLPIVRNQMPKVLQLFDFADPNAALGNRNARTIPAQALYLMNNPFVEELAGATADRILTWPEAERVKRTWQLLTGRMPNPEMITRAEEFVLYRMDETKGEQREAWMDVVQTLFASAPFRYLE